MGRAQEMLAKLRAETKRPDIEELEALAREEERASQYFTALLVERVGVAAEIHRLEGLDPQGRAPHPWDDPTKEVPTNVRRLADSRRRLDAIDAELERVGSGEG
jgi:hypothetical protein